VSSVRLPLVLALLLSIAAPSLGTAQTIDVPNWQLNDRWRLRRDIPINVDLGKQGAVDLDVREEYDLTISSVSVDPVHGPVYTLTRSNASVTGSGTGTFPGVGTLNLTLGAASTTSGTEVVRIGDLAEIRSATSSRYVIRATIVVAITIANVDVVVNTTNETGQETFDFPLVLGDQFDGLTVKRLEGSLNVDFTGPLSGQQDINQPFDATAPVAPRFTVEDGPTAGTLQIAQVGSNLIRVWSESFERPASSVLEGFQGGDIDPITETTLSATLVSRPSFAVTITPNPAGSGSTVSVFGTTSPLFGDLRLFIMPGSPDAIDIEIDGAGGFFGNTKAPTTDDGSPTLPRDDGSFGLVLLNESGGVFARTLQRDTEPPTSGLLAR